MSKLTTRQKDVIRNLIQNEIHDLFDDINEDPSYSDELSVLEELFKDSNRIEVFNE